MPALRSQAEFFVAGIAPVGAVPGNEADCSICTEPLEEDVVRLLACNHSFHCICVLSWLQGRNVRGDENRTCPNCRCELYEATPRTATPRIATTPQATPTSTESWVGFEQAFRNLSVAMQPFSASRESGPQEHQAAVVPTPVTPRRHTPFRRPDNRADDIENPDHWMLSMDEWLLESSRRTYIRRTELLAMCIDDSDYSHWREQTLFARNIYHTRLSRMANITGNDVHYGAATLEADLRRVVQQYAQTDSTLDGDVLWNRVFEILQLDQSVETIENIGS